MGLTVVVQFQDRKDCDPERVREFVDRFRGKVKYWEIINEPNFSMSPEEYARLVADVAPRIKRIDRQAQVMGPAVCGINLDWHDATFRAGAGKHLDIISIHDYEGNESIDPGHWRWKFARLRELMAKHGVGNKPIWQTERAIGGVRADNFLGGVQVVRVTLQRDVLDTLGIFEVTHAGSPWGPYWAGDLSHAPQSLDVAFSQPRPVNRLIVYSMRADNPHCYLLDFDVQVHDGRQWVTRAEVRSPLPPSDLVRTAQSKANTWYLDQNFAVVEFPTVTTDRLRIVARRSTLGFQPDAAAVKATGWQAGGPNLHLREVEVYGPPPAVEIAGKLREPLKRQAFDREPVTLTAINHTDRRREVTARLVAPEGWTTDPAEVQWKLEPNATRSATVQLVAPGEIPTGSIPLSVTLLDEQNRPLDYRRMVLAIQPPVEVIPLTPPAIDESNQPLAVKIRNLTDQPLTGTVRLTLSGPAAIEPLDQALDTIAPQAEYQIEWRVPGLKLSQAAWTANYSVTTNRLITTAEQRFAQMRLWQVLGPFPNPDGQGFDTAFAPEKQVDVSKPVAVPGGAAKTLWKPASNNPAGFVDLLQLFQPNHHVCAYAVIYVKSPNARRALLSAGSDDGVKIWINGDLKISHDITRGAAPGQEEQPVDLRAGWNEVLMKITQGDGGWRFYFDLLTPAGEPMPDLVFAPKRGN